jgi:hypothetical protein
MTNKVETRGRKVGTKLVDDNKRKKVLFYVPTNFYDLIMEAKNQKIQTAGYLLNEIIKTSVKTSKIDDSTFKHALVINGKEVVSIVNNTPKQDSVMVKRG